MREKLPAVARKKLHMVAREETLMAVEREKF